VLKKTDWIDKSWDIVWKCTMTNSQWWSPVGYSKHLLRKQLKHRQVHQNLSRYSRKNSTLSRYSCTITVWNSLIHFCHNYADSTTQISVFSGSKGPKWNSSNPGFRSCRIQGFVNRISTASFLQDRCPAYCSTRNINMVMKTNNLLWSNKKAKK